MVHRFLDFVLVWMVVPVLSTHYKPIPRHFDIHHLGNGGGGTSHSAVQYLTTHMPASNPNKYGLKKTVTVSTSTPSTRTYVRHIGVPNNIKRVAVAYHGEYLRKEILFHTKKEGCSVFFNCFKNITDAITEPLNRLNITTLNFFGKLYMQ
jgi:hypothetical protein